MRRAGVGLGRLALASGVAKAGSEESSVPAEQPARTRATPAKSSSSGRTSGSSSRGTPSTRAAPDRRQLWRNDLTNEERFGLVATEPGTEPTVVLEGKDDEWDDNGSQVIAESRGEAREVRAVRDEQYLYLLLRSTRTRPGASTPSRSASTCVPGGNAGVPGHDGVYPQAEVAAVVGPDDQAELFQAAWWEPTRVQYGLGRGYIKVDGADMKPGSGAWVHPMQTLNERRKAGFDDLGATMRELSRSGLEQ